MLFLTFSYGSRFLILIIYVFGSFFHLARFFILVIHVFVLDLVYACLEGAVSRRARLYGLEHPVRHETTTKCTF